MTRDEFIDGYCKKSGITREFFFENGDAVPCDCGEDGCAGWQYDTSRSPSHAIHLTGSAAAPSPLPLGAPVYFFQDAADAGSLRFSMSGKTVVCLKPDGTIEMGEGYTPTEAAEEFIAILRDALPGYLQKPRAALDYANRKLEVYGARIAALEGGIVAENKRTSVIERELQAVKDLLVGRDEDFHPKGEATVAEVIERILGERDTALSCLDRLGRRVEDVQAALNECGAGFAGQPEATRIRDLRARLARYEAVVQALPRCGHRFGCAARGTRSDGYTAFCDEHGGFALTPLPWNVALRALEEVSGGSGAAHDGGRLMPGPTVATAGPPESAGGCDHKRRRCENDHDVCVDCGSVNRAVSGFADWGPAAPAGASAAARPDCECLDWTQVGHPASAYWPDMHPNYHHPDCQNYIPIGRTLDEAWEGVMITYTEHDVPGDEGYQRSVPGWKCRHCGWQLGTAGLPPVQCSKCGSRWNREGA